MLGCSDARMLERGCSWMLGRSEARMFAARRLGGLEARRLGGSDGQMLRCSEFASPCGCVKRNRQSTRLPKALQL